ncbi:MAG: class I SAM-dependent methyltransferase [Phycisphaerales bacterium]|nr:class I SAM-dependent methyltransferase [Phycisphaerales bacterium]
MPSILENVRQWRSYDWSSRGSEWCEGYGGVENAWQHAVLPRIRSFVPTGHVLELGPGYGVWTDYLCPQPARAKAARKAGGDALSRQMTLVDLAPNCIKFCRKRFGRKGMLYYANDGRSLRMIDDESIDFVFSFNSLVHADLAVMREYLLQLGRKLKPGAFGFIHHSNLGEYSEEFGHMDPAYEHWRGRDMTGERFREACREAGLVCIVQELLPWGSERFIDAHSLFVRPNPGQRFEERIIHNPDYFEQARAGDHTAEAWYRRTP